jgi:hypothetical protein
MKVAATLLRQWYSENPARLLQAALWQAERLAEMEQKRGQSTNPDRAAGFAGSIFGFAAFFARLRGRGNDEGVSQQFLTDLELSPLGWRGLWAGNRQVEIGGPTDDPVGEGTKQTHLPDERKMAIRLRGISTSSSR